VLYNTEEFNNIVRCLFYRTIIILHKFFLVFWLWYVVSYICICGGKDDRFVDKGNNNIKCEETSGQGLSLKEAIYQ
jgi:hypothetical protein